MRQVGARGLRPRRVTSKGFTTALPRMSKTMPSGDPSEDPKADMDITGGYEPVDYAINDSLIEMAECADQAPGVVLMSEELGERKSEGEEGGEEEGGDDYAAEAGRLPTIEASRAVDLCSEKQHKKGGGRSCGDFAGYIEFGGLSLRLFYLF